MTHPSVPDVAIIGGGPAGYTAAIYSARAGLHSVLYQGPQPGGQLTITTDVENYPGYPAGIKGPEMMELFLQQAQRFGTQVVAATVRGVNFKDYPFHLTLEGGEEVRARSVIIATGSSAKWLEIPSEKRLYGKGVSACAVCDGFFFRGQEVAVVGGGIVRRRKRVIWPIFVIGSIYWCAVIKCVLLRLCKSG